MSVKTDSREQRALAAQQRDRGVATLNPGREDYDEQMRSTWGGPSIKWYNRAVARYQKFYPKNSDQIALVTGSIGGIGFYVAKALAAVGYTVIIPSRSGLEADAEGAKRGILREFPNAKVVIPKTPLDLGSFPSVRAFGAAIRHSYKKIDRLCLNAGRGGGVNDPREVTIDGQEAIMQVNAFGHYLLTDELMPLLRASNDARIVSQTSGARYQAKIAKVDDINGTDAENFNAFDQYCLSKCANVLFTKCLNERLLAHNIHNVTACVSDPGLTSTGVNIQHDLTNSIGMKNINTNQMHDARGHHAGDGALPMIVGTITPHANKNDWFTTDGVDAKTFTEAGHVQDPIERDRNGTDPLVEANYPREKRESFWRQAKEATGAIWNGITMSNQDLIAKL